MIPDTEDGKVDANSTAIEQDTRSNQSIEELVMTLALQKREWQELRGSNGIILRMDNYRDPPSGRSYLLLVFGIDGGDIQGNDATGEIFVNGRSIDEILPEIIKKPKKYDDSVEKVSDEV